MYVSMNRQGHHNIRNGIVWVQTGRSTCTCTVSHLHLHLHLHLHQHQHLHLHLHLPLPLPLPLPLHLHIYLYLYLYLYIYMYIFLYVHIFKQIKNICVNMYVSMNRQGHHNIRKWNCVGANRPQHMHMYSLIACN